MLDHGQDQASGLRRSMNPAGGRLLPVAGAGEHPGFVSRLAQSLCDGGLRIALVSDFDQELAQLAQGRHRNGLMARHTLQLGPDLRLLDSVCEQVDLTLVAVDDRRLVRGLNLPVNEAVVLAGAGPEAIATAYARIKAMVGFGSVREVCTLFERGSSSASARNGHERLAQAASRFLGIDLAFGGAAPAAAVPGGYRRLADDLADWACKRSLGRAPCLSH